MLGFIILLRRRFAAALLPRLFWINFSGHTTRAPPVGFEPETNGIQFYVIANLDIPNNDIHFLRNCNFQFVQILGDDVVAADRHKQILVVRVMPPNFETCKNLWHHCLKSAKERM